MQSLQLPWPRRSMIFMGNISICKPTLSCHDDSPFRANCSLRKWLPAIVFSHILEKHVTECWVKDFKMNDFLKSNCLEGKLLMLSVKLGEASSNFSFHLTKWLCSFNKIINYLPKSEIQYVMESYKICFIGHIISH